MPTALAKSPISSNVRMVGALEKRRLLDLFNAVKAKSEQMANAGLADLRKAEGHIYGGRHVDAAELLHKTSAALDERAEAQALASQQAEAERLATLRSVETERSDGKPPSRDGWIWLLRKGRINVERRLAGERYSALYGQCRADGVRSALNDSHGSGQGAPVQDKRLMAIGDLNEAHVHIRKSVGDVSAGRFINLMDAVCGRGEQLTEIAAADVERMRAKGIKVQKQDRALVLETDLMVALDMTARHFSIA